MGAFCRTNLSVKKGSTNTISLKKGSVKWSMKEAMKSKWTKETENDFKIWIFTIHIIIYNTICYTDN